MKNFITIGRSSHCDIIIPNESISREHARLSIVNGQYIYEDIGKNGSVICGRSIQGERLAITPGANVLLAGRIPLPWDQIYSILPLKGINVYGGETKVEAAHIIQNNYQEPIYCGHYKEDSLALGWGILAFLIPLAGWIMYFVWKEETPNRASKAAGLAWGGFFFNLVFVFSAI